MLNSDNAADRYTANGITTNFAYNFRILTKNDIEVSVNDVVKTVDTDYAVSGLGDSGGGTVTFLAAPADTSIVALLRKQTLEQQSKYTPNEAFPAERIEKDLDKAMMVCQQLQEAISRALKYKKSSSLVDHSIDAPVEGKFARAKVGGGIDWATPTAAGALSSPVPVADGGTGAITAAAARTNLGANWNELIDAKGDLLAGSADDTLARHVKGTDGYVLQAESGQSTGLLWVPNRPPSLIINPFFQIDQRVGGSVADDVYCADRWYVLTQTGAIAYAMQTLQENGQASNIRLTQSQAAAQRFGIATILEAKDSQPYRGQTVTFRPRVRISNSQAIRIAVLEWTGTADTVTSDVVNDWTNATYTAGQFFLAANLTVSGVGAKTPGAATWTDMDALTVTLSSSLNNLIVFIWTEGTAAQNVTLDVGKVRLVPGSAATDILVPTFPETLYLCKRYYQKSFIYTTAPAQNAGLGSGEYRWLATLAGANAHMGPSWVFQVPMRIGPTMTWYNPAAANAQIRNITDGADMTLTTTRAGSADHIQVQFTGAAGNAVGEELAVHWVANAEL